MDVELAAMFGTRLKFSAAGFCALTLAGCMTPEPQNASGVALPARFSNASGAAAPLPRLWPKLFGSSELARLSASAFDNNFDIAVAGAKIRQAQAQLSQSGAALQPQISGYGDASRTQSPGTARAKTAPFNSSTSNSFDLGLTASYMLDFWGKNASSVEAARDQLVATQFDRDTVQLSTLAAVSNAYLQGLAAQDRLKIAGENIRLSSEVLEAIRGRIKVGTSTALEEASQEVIATNARALVPELQLSAQQARNTLAVLVGQVPERLKLAGGGLGLLHVPHISAGLPSQLLTRRPDIAAAEARLAAQKANVEAARAALLPNVSLNGKLGLQSLTLQNLIRPEAILASVASSLTAPIFDGGNLQGQLDADRALREQLLFSYRKDIIQALADVENALAAVKFQTRHEALQTEAIRASRRAYEINLTALKSGTIDLVNLLNSETSLFNAQDVLVQIRLAKFQAYVSLIQALGGGWDMKDVK